MLDADEAACTREYRVSIGSQWLLTHAWRQHLRRWQLQEMHELVFKPFESIVHCGAACSTGLLGTREARAAI